MNVFGIRLKQSCHSLFDVLIFLQVVDVDNIRQKVTVKLIPRVDLQTLANKLELCKYFKPGDHVKVVSGVQEGATGMVVKVEGHVLIILSDTTKEHVSYRISGDVHMTVFELSSNMSFGVIIRVETEAFQVNNFGR
ncbi:hypothetical protein BHE74_00043605 [Ensete ventricosum]|nr:hypothetical protein BHE74_00043605 [Ensete ventricosum]